ncbi:uncharacterized protein LOC105838621, partial [Monomorium pharaonis]|uniref:uncharacterized protein LOC105838621 n=1 Tax=Monomorium pharaonis TaxID=307658 RepID=UPI001746D65D
LNSFFFLYPDCNWFQLKLPFKVKPPLAKWKFHRWLKWAISQNVIDPADYFIPIRYLRVISPLKYCNGSVVRNKSDVTGNSISSNEIERSNKFTRRRTRSQRVPDLPITSKEEATEDINRWIDFNKMASYVTDVHLFYKLEYFQCSIQVTGDTLKINNENRKAEVPKASTKEIKKEKTGTFIHLHVRTIKTKAIKYLYTYNNIDKIVKSGYKPLYLFCDSPKKKFFLVNLCTAPKMKNADLHKRDYLILEKYDWFHVPDSSNQSITISTTGNKSTVMELEAGRQLLRINSRLDYGLMIISSDTNFHLGDRATVQQLMTTESVRIEQISKTISDNLCKMYRSFGTKEYPAMLQNFYRSYIPNLQLVPSRKNKNFRTLIHHFFMEEQVRLIRETVPDKEFEDFLYSLRIFFLNPYIRSEYLDLTTNQKTLRDLITRETSKTWFPMYKHKEGSTDDQAATMIQSFLKMALIKKYKQFHNSEHTLHTQIRERLLKISDLFDSFFVSQLLRNVINRHKNLLQDLYPCSEDFIHVLNIQEFRGIVGSIRQEQWFPIVRLVINPKPAESVFAAFELLINLPRFALRVFNNQNGREVTRLMNHVIPAHYNHLPEGYTVFAYGWSDKQHFKELNWAIRIVTIKGDPILYQLGDQRPLSLETKLPKLTVDELIGTYIPNARDCISRWILRSISERSIISVRLTTSYNLAEIRVKIVDKDDNILVDVKGGSTILLPLVILNHSGVNDENYRTENKNQDINKEFENARKKKNLYYIEAFVLNNSWPLTDVEWTVVSQAKVKITGDINKTKSGSRTSSRSSLLTMRKQFVSNGQVLESPFWILQIVTDAWDAIEVCVYFNLIKKATCRVIQKICRDNSKEQEIILLKESWQSKDSSRPERGKDLREAFLNAYASKMKSDASSNRNGMQLKLIEDKDMVFCLPHTRQYRTLKPLESVHLPALDLAKYTRDEIMKNHQIKTKINDELLKSQCITIITDSQTNYSNYLENLAELINKQLRRYAKNIDKRKKNFWQRRSLIDAAYETRKTYVDNLLSERAKNKAKGKKD